MPLHVSSTMCSSLGGPPDDDDEHVVLETCRGI